MVKRNRLPSIQARQCKYRHAPFTCKPNLSFFSNKKNLYWIFSHFRIGIQSITHSRKCSIRIDSPKKNVAIGIRRCTCRSAKGPECAPESNLVFLRRKPASSLSCVTTRYLCRQNRNRSLWTFVHFCTRHVTDST